MRDAIPFGLKLNEVLRNEIPDHKGLLLATAKPTPFSWREAGSALWESKWEVALPFVVLFGIFGGFTTLVEASAITVIYALIAECFVYKDIRIQTDLIPIFVKSATLV